MTSEIAQNEFAQAPGLLSFLPMLFVAWSDDVLTPSQAEIIKKTVDTQSWLTPNEKTTLYRWLDPSRPPTAPQLKTWLRIIHNTSDQIPDASRQKLSTLGTQIAKACATGEQDKYVSDEAVAALKQVEEALEVFSVDASREMLLDHIRPEGVDTSITTPAFEVKGLQAILDGKNQETIRKVKVLLSDSAFSLKKVSPVKEEFRETVMEWCQLLADQGLGSLSYPEFAGGKNDMAAYVSIFETMGYHDLSLLIKFGVQFGLFGGSILNLGTEYHHKKYLKEVGTLALPGCFAMTEADHGSNVRDIETTATYDPATETFEIHTPNETSYKEYIGNAAVHGRMASVFAQLTTLGESYGVHALLVPIRDEAGNPMPGVRIGDSGDKLGLNGVDNGRLWFDKVKIPRENLLDRFGQVDKEGTYSSPIPGESRRFFTMLGTLVGGRVCVPMAGLSAAKKGLTIAIKYGDKRRQFGPAGAPEIKILDYRTHQRRLMPLLAKSYALHFAHRYGSELYLAQDESNSREVEAIAAGLKSVSTWHTTATLQECREACGGNGYMRVNQFADLKADTEIFTTFEGDNTVLMQLVAKGRLAEFKREFRDLNFMRVAKWVGQRAATFFAELNPLVTGNTATEHLLDTAFHLAAFRFREEDLVRSVASRLKSRLDNEMDPTQAMNECQDHLVTMAHAYIDRIILEQFVFALEKITDPAIQKTMTTVCNLYALHTIETHRGWYLEQGYIDGGKSKAIRNQVNALCGEVRQDAIALVDAFGIPGVMLGDLV